MPATAVYPIAALYVYPIKSCRGIGLQSSRLLKEGLEFDRRFMLIDEHNHFLTIRQNPRLALIIPELRQSPEGTDTELIVSITGIEGQMSVPARPCQSYLEDCTQEAPVEIWKTWLKAHIFPCELTSFISQFLGQTVRLAYHDPRTNLRFLQGNGSLERLGAPGSVGYADGLPLQIASLASLGDLNQRLAAKGRKAISIQQFRPNIVIGQTSDSCPWDEDTWSIVSIIVGDEDKMVIDIVSRCARCQVPNVDIDSAIKDKYEPWTTLMTFRRIDSGISYKPCFGMLGVPRTDNNDDEQNRNVELGLVTIGDVLRVEQRTNEHCYVSGF